MSRLLDPLTIRGVTFRNRVFVSPMCEYSSDDGFANDWHLVHLGSRAVGGAGLTFTEATAVTPEGRISPQDLGIWKDEHVEMLSRIVRFIHEQGSVAGMQLAHAGRKGSTRRPWDGSGEVSELDGGWRNVLAPSAIPFSDDYPRPIEMTPAMISRVVSAFAAATRRALKAGFQVIEIHAAHGYLIHEFLSPLSNQRGDGYGGPFENRTRLAREITTAVRQEWPEQLPVFIRISSTDWVDNGWDLDQSVALIKMLKPLGVDFVDCSSGGNVARASIPIGPGYQVPFAERIRKDAEVPTGAVGMITTPEQAEEIISSGRADAVLLARELLRDPYFPLRAGRELGQEIAWPAQYLRAAPPGAKPRDSH
jgi:2,4-dienoyl-CoA reductase-like NADH-dependent reductase (Old Yellow Enzyme family)